jgi:hypothetical protein
MCWWDVIRPYALPALLLGVGVVLIVASEAPGLGWALVVLALAVVAAVGSADRSTGRRR